MTVLVAGAGIGGLTLALSLHQVGVDVRVFEAVRTLKPLGVGINLQPLNWQPVRLICSREIEIKFILSQI